MEDVHGHEWSTELNSPFATDREAAPDPVTDFIARRVAKREEFNRGAERINRPDRPGNYWIFRAMSQPGPHDTPMRARLMPWRGEE